MPSRNHAIVIGGSLAGLVAARVLSDHFARVTVVERDPLDDTAEIRKGVPQAAHVHLLLGAGASILAELFPELPQRLREGGSVTVDLSRDVLWYAFGGYKLRYASGLEASCQSRAFLDMHVRRLLFARPNIECLSRTAVLALVSQSSRNVIRGVRILSRDGRGERTVEADLVVDASGRGSSACRWLESLGFKAPEESVINVDVGYATRIYKRSAGSRRNSEVVWTQASPGRPKRHGGIFPIEGDRWILTVAGWCGDHPPVDERKLMVYLRTLETDDVVDALRDAEPLTRPVSYRFLANRRRHFERLDRCPENFLVLGDAACAFNPAYGQGMTAAALGAKVLKAHLEDATGTARAFFARLSFVVDVPWTMAAREDLRVPAVQGARDLRTLLLHWYTARVHRETMRDRDIMSTFLRVMNLLERPSALLERRVVTRVLVGLARDILDSNGPLYCRPGDAPAQR